MSVRKLTAAVAFCVLIAASASAQTPAPSGFPAFKGFDERIGAAKSAMMGDPKAALTQADAALAIADVQPAGNSRALARATAEWLQGEALNRINQPRRAAPILDAALADVARIQPNSKLHGDLIMARGASAAAVGDILPALEDFQKAYAIFQRAGQPRGQAKALQNIGTIYQDAGDYGRVLSYYAQSAEVYRGDPALTVSARNNTGNAYKQQHRYLEAEAEFRLALDAARQMKSRSLEARILTNLASVEVLDGKLAEADADIARGLKITEGDASAREWRPFLWGVAAQAALKRGRPADAAALVQRTFAGQDLTTTTLPYRDFHQVAWQAFARVGKPALALAHLEAFKRLDDAAHNLAASTNGALMTARFDFANQSLKITQLKADQLERDRRFAVSMIAVLALAGLLVSSVLVFGFLSVRRSRNLIRAANAELSRANLALAGALKARNDFLATTSHEIRTPLNGILGMSEVILADAGLEAGLRDKVALIQDSGVTMRMLVDDILDLAKLETGRAALEPAAMDLSTVLDATQRFWTDQARAHGLVLELDAEASPAGIVQDERRLRQILFNLMANAIKFTPAGKVKLSAGTRASEAGERLVIRVTDTGIGIPADMHEAVFEPFRQVEAGATRQFGGAGLGLAICRDLARAMGGDLTIESALGQGSTFTLDLPLVRVEAGTAPATAPRGPVRDLSEAAVLVVEPNALTQSVLRAGLAPSVGELVVVGTAALALETLATRRFEIVVVDEQAAGADAPARAATVSDIARAAPGAALAVLCAADEDHGSGSRTLVKPLSLADLSSRLQAFCEESSNAITGSDRVKPAKSAA